MNSTFDELSQSMSTDEKKDLLGRIQSSLNLSAKDTDSIISKAENPEELRHRLQREVSKLGFLERLMLRVAGFFGNRADYEVLGDRKLAVPRAVLRERIPDLISFPREELTPEFAKIVFDFYAEAAALKAVFDSLFQQKLTLEASLLLMIREEHPAAVRSVDDLFPERERAEVYRADQKRSSLHTQLDKRLEAYLDSVPEGVFDKVRDRLKPLYFLRPLMQYPYAFLLELFGYAADKGDVTKYPFFLGAPWTKAAGLLERLHYGLHLSTKIEWEKDGLTQLLKAVADKTADEKTPWTVDSLEQRLETLVRTAQDVSRRIPWREVLQWSFQDPYYSVKFVLPRFSVRDFYQNTLVMNLREELDSLIPALRQRLLEEEKALLFQGAATGLEFYVPGLAASLGPNQKARGFQHPESLALLWGFLTLHFSRRIQPFHQSLARMVSAAGKSSLQGLNGAVDDLASLRTRIHQFDRSLHPDTEEGKDFQKLRYELNTKALSLKPFVQLIQNKDAQALELLNRGVEGLQALKGQLEGVRERNIPALKAILKLPYLLEGQTETIENGLERFLVIVQKTLFVLREAQSLEG